MADVIRRDNPDFEREPKATAGGTFLLVFLSIITIGIVAVWYITSKNKLFRQENDIEESISGIDVALTKRFDTLKKQYDVVKGYAKHEGQTLTDVTKMRVPSQNATMEERNEFAAATSRALQGINVVVENYPDLKASANFQELQHAINDVENHLQAARRLYNANVKEMNNMIVSFPKSIPAARVGYTKFASFEADQAKRADVDLTF